MPLRSPTAAAELLHPWTICREVLRIWADALAASGVEILSIYLKLLAILAEFESGTHPAFLLACPEGTKKKTAPTKVAIERATARLKVIPDVRTPG